MTESKSQEKVEKAEKLKRIKLSTSINIIIDYSIYKIHLQAVL
jgi:hypothetical protein